MENNNQQFVGQSGQQYYGQPYQGQPYYGQQQGTPNLAKPDSNLVWGILTTLLCCLPFGVVSIIKASKVDSLWYAGRYQEAYDAAKSAKNWALASIAGAVWLFIFYFVLGFMSAL
jgi:hypothetical protein